uniref:Uncharacterized protein n=1 Tax=Anguilla anguilla TaxID=7936 RepID=A0A0E9S0R3_ANGAN
MTSAGTLAKSYFVVLNICCKGLGLDWMQFLLCINTSQC